jgi:hypothetical protein
LFIEYLNNKALDLTSTKIADTTDTNDSAELSNARGYKVPLTLCCLAS